jgi:methionine salvage enolase-phosphatase E1
VGLIIVSLLFKVYIYSSGSREAQQLLFSNSNYGDLKKYLCGFFDTTVGYVFFMHVPDFRYF